MKNYAVVANIKAEQKGIIDDVFDKGYEQGYHDGKLDGEAEKLEKEKDEAYRKGFAEGRGVSGAIVDLKKAEYDRGFDEGYARAKLTTTNDAYEAGYDKGYEKGKQESIEACKKCERTWQDGYSEGYDKGLQHGQELRIEEAECAEACGMRKGWETARKVLQMPMSDLDQVFPGWDEEHVIEQLSVKEVVEKLEAWEKKQKENEKVDCNNIDCKNCINHNACDYEDEWKLRRRGIVPAPPKEKQTEKHCSNCDNAGAGGDAVVCYECENHSNYEPKQKETEKKCENCKWMELDCNNPAICKDMALYEPKDIEEDVKVGDTIRTIKDKDYLNIELFPIGTIGRVIKIESEGNFLRYKVRVGNECWIYSRDMFEVINQDAPEMNVESIEVGDEVYQLDKNYTYIVTNTDDKIACFFSRTGHWGCRSISELHKTGRHFPIQEILDAMKNNSEENNDNDG